MNEDEVKRRNKKTVEGDDDIGTDNDVIDATTT